MNGISIIGLYIIFESPEYLYNSYRFSECREVILRIAKWNKHLEYLSPIFRFDRELEVKKIWLSNQLAQHQDTFVEGMKRADSIRISKEI